MATDLRLPINKFSHAIGVGAGNNLPWEHLQATNLVVVVRGRDTSVPDGELIMRVVHANDTKVSDMLEFNTLCSH